MNNESNIHEQLMQAVTFHRVAEVKQLLARGADPNYESPEYSKFSDRRAQPYSPLRLVMFCISDSLLDDNGLRDFAEIAKLLLEYGADPEPAMQIAELRYGKYSPDRNSGYLMDVWNIVANAQR